MLEMVSWKVLGKFWHVLSANPMLWQFPWKFHVSQTKRCPSTAPLLLEGADAGDEDVLLEPAGVGVLWKGLPPV